jgi:C-terminal processing protease CtpA/Prc
MKKKSTGMGWLALIAGVAVMSVGGAKYRDFRENSAVVRADGLEGLLASREQGPDPVEGDYYDAIVSLLKDRYVDEVKDDTKLLTGAIRGMVVGLKDVDSQFYNPAEFAAFKGIRAGQYNGVGVWLDYRPAKVQTKIEGSDIESLLRLTVVSVAPGSAAAKAGVLVGDLVDEVDGSWVSNSEVLLAFRKAQIDFAAKKIDFKVINDLRKELKSKFDRSITAAKAREKLITGAKGTTKVIWERGGKKITTSLTKALIEIPKIDTRNGITSIVFTAGTAEDLSREIEGKTSITLDLRNNVLGDLESMKRCLSVIAPAGVYGYYENEKGGVPSILKTDKGATKRFAIKLLVDASTRDAAEIFANALASKGLATLSGGATGDAMKQKEITQLPDGSGYTMVTGKFFTGVPANKPKAATKSLKGERV